MSNLPVPIPRTFSVGETETASFLNTAVRDATTFLLNPPEAVLTATAVQTLTTGSFTALAFDTATVDTYGGHSNVTNNTRYTAQVAGWYWVLGQSSYAVNGTGGRQMTIAKNGTQVLGSMVGVPASSVINELIQCSYLVQLNAGDYVEVQAWQTSGGNLNTVTGQSAMNVLWVHA